MYRHLQTPSISPSPTGVPAAPWVSAINADIVFLDGTSDLNFMGSNTASFVESPGRGLGSVRMLGFGPPQLKTPTSTRAGVFGMNGNNTNATAGMLGFEGTGRKGVEFRIIFGLILAFVVTSFTL